MYIGTCLPNIIVCTKARFSSLGAGPSVFSHVTLGKQRDNWLYSDFKPTY